MIFLAQNINTFFLPIPFMRNGNSFSQRGRWRYCVCLFVFLFSLSLLQARSRHPRSANLSLADMFSGISQSSPSQWVQGMPFIFLNDHVGLSLSPEVPLEASDSASVLGSRWLYDSMVSEEDWMGQQLLQLRFQSPDGKYYRYSTGQSMSAMSDTAFHPALTVLYPEVLIQHADSILRTRTLYILYNDERVFYLADSLSNAVRHRKFIPVRIDSVTYGVETAPLRVSFTNEAGEAGYFFTSLPGSRQVATSVPITRYLSVTDPYVDHPDISLSNWNKIQYSQVELDMTSEEVRLSWGRPSRIEKIPTRSGLVEYWYYSNNRVLQILDGRLAKVGIL